MLFVIDSTHLTDGRLNIKAPLLVVVSKDSCPHCISLQPTLQEISKNFPVGIIKADGDQTVLSHLSTILPAMEVQGIPFIAYHAGETIIEYQGNRSLPDLEQFISKSNAIISNQSKVQQYFMRQTKTTKPTIKTTHTNKKHITDKNYMYIVVGACSVILISTVLYMAFRKSKK